MKSQSIPFKRSYASKADRTHSNRIYKPELERLQADRAKAKEAAKADNLSRAMKDMTVSVPLSGQKGGITRTAGGKSSKGPKTAKELLADLEAQEAAEEQEEAEQGWTEEAEDIYTEDHDMYQDLRREQERRSGVSKPRKAVVDDEFGSRWPAP